MLSKSRAKWYTRGTDITRLPVAETDPRKLQQRDKFPAVFPGLTLSCWLVDVYLWRALIAPCNGQGEGHGFMSMRVSLRAGSRVGKGASASNETSRFQTFDRQGIGARMWALDVQGDMSKHESTRSLF